MLYLVFFVIIWAAHVESEVSLSVYWLFVLVFIARILSALCYPSVCRTGGSVKTVDLS